MKFRERSTRTKVLSIVGAAAMVIGLFVGWHAARAWFAWNSVERVGFDLLEARNALPTAPGAPDAEENPMTMSTSLAEERTYRSVLILGSDERTPEERERSFADAILLYLVPDDGGSPSIVSFPRDLVVTDPCSGEVARLNQMLEACGESISGPEHVALALEDETDFPVDHFALVRFQAFKDVVDSVGGIELCLPYSIRERDYDIAPAGCSMIDGAHALAFIRSRATQELVDGEWHFSDQLGDSARIGRHSTVLFALIDRMQQMRSPTQLVSIAEEVGDSVVLSETIGLGDAVAMAWELRMRRAGLRTFTLPGEGTNLADGTYAVVPTISIRELIER